MEKQETMLDYVKRKLLSKAYNNAEVMRSTGINKATLSDIATGRAANPAFSTVQRIYEYFKGVDK